MKEKSGLTGVKEIARRAKVSIATVDRVIHNRTGVSLKTKNKINKIIEELNYQPNIFARRLASRKIFEFAVLIPQASAETTYWQAPLSGILQAEKEIKPFGINITRYLFNQDDKISFTKQYKLILKKKTDGVLLAPVFIKETIVFIKACRKAGIPYVFIDSDIPNQERLCYIGPDLFQSGYLGGHLISYGITEKGKVMVVNISKDVNSAKEIEDRHRFFRKEEGLRAYFENNRMKNEIVKVDIEQTDYPAIKKRLSKALNENPGIRAICVTNSRVSSVARYLAESDTRHFFLIGFDFTDDNIDYLEKGIIDFIICDKPQEQGYRGIMTLYQSLVMGLKVDDVYYMPIDIITKENYVFYRN